MPQSFSSWGQAKFMTSVSELLVGFLRMLLQMFIHMLFQEFQTFLYLFRENCSVVFQVGHWKFFCSKRVTLLNLFFT